MLLVVDVFSKVTQKTNFGFFFGSMTWEVFCLDDNDADDDESFENNVELRKAI